MPALHQAEHLARVAADLQRLAVEVALQRVERAHDVADGLVAVVAGVRRLGAVRLLQHAGVGLADHPLAVVHADQVLLEDVVVEHVLGGLAEVDDPLAQVRRRDAVGHVLRVTEQVAWLSPQMPQIRLVMKCASRGSLPFMKML